MELLLLVLGWGGHKIQHMRERERDVATLTFDFYCLTIFLTVSISSPNPLGGAFSSFQSAFVSPSHDEELYQQQLRLDSSAPEPDSRLRS
jgi:hypothetical protein